MNRDREALRRIDRLVANRFPSGATARQVVTDVAAIAQEALALPVGGGVEERMTREEVIAGMAVELDRCPGFFRDLGTGDRTVKACVWATRLFDAALSPTTLGVE